MDSHELALRLCHCHHSSKCSAEGNLDSCHHMEPRINPTGGHPQYANIAMCGIGMPNASWHDLARIRFLLFSSGPECWAQSTDILISVPAIGGFTRRYFWHTAIGTIRFEWPC